ncbi:MAG: hypothetical protein O7G30_16580 [Proteobacteria bacterium]|nr:hypothetical protein [Pseudomonadota bacterium]
MTRTKLTWALLGVLYVSFFSWYTSCGGPLRPGEVEHYMALMDESGRGADPELRAIMREFLESDTGDDFVMLNVIDMHETPLPMEGVESGETSEEVLARYMEYMLPALLRRACHPVLYGTAAGDAPEMFGIEGAREWTTGAGMRYRSRRDLMEIATNPAFQGSHQFKIAAIDKTIAFPIDPWFQLGDPRLLLALIFVVIGLAVGWHGARSQRAEGGL